MRGLFFRETHDTGGLMRVAIGSDHVGLELKQQVADWLREDEFDVLDLGPGSFDPTDDYTDFARRVAEAVAGREADCGVVICSTGQGSCMTANKVRGIRAALCHDLFCARLSKEHNNANVLCLGASVVGPLLAREILRTWLATPFTGEARHQRRLDKMAQVESGEGAP
jgi:ribose 5-phosphate isomerase B